MRASHVGSVVVLLSVLLLAVVPALYAQSAVPISVNSTVAASVSTSDTFVCATLDWWPASKCDYGVCAWGNASLLHLNLSQPLLQNAVKALAPLHLRLGGSLADFVLYQQFSDADATSRFAVSGKSWNKEIMEVAGPCDQFDAATNSTVVGYPYFSGCLWPERWVDLLSFCEDNGCSYIFGLNYLYGRTPPPLSCSDNCRWASPRPACCTVFTGAWDPTNAQQFVQWNAQKTTLVYAWELGNELDGSGNQASIGATEYAQDVVRLRSIINSAYATAPYTPKLFAADGMVYNAGWATTFLSTAAASMDGFTYHDYPLGAGVDPQSGVRALDPSSMDGIISVAADAKKTVSASPNPSIQIWMGETGGAYNSGRPGVTDTYHGSFWYLDEMSLFALHGHSGFCRQTLIGGNYGLLDRDTFLPNPDFYAAQLFANLMGPIALNANKPSGTSDYLRVYASCTNKRASEQNGAVTVLIINVNNSTKFSVDLSSIQPDKTSIRKEYRINSATDINGKIIQLNGQNLIVASDGTFPVLQGEQVQMSNLLTLIPYSYTFVVFPQANAAVCL